MQQRFVKAGGVRIRYLEWEATNVVTPTDTPDRKRHVLFIHGLGSSADRWLDIPAALSLSFHAVAIDLPGFGGSDKPAELDYTIDKFGEVVGDFMHEIGIDDGKTSIVGHSLGGYIAAHLAIERRNLVERLALIDSSGMLSEPTPLLKQYLAAAMNPSKESLRAVFEQMVADPVRIIDLLVEGFIARINQPNAKHAFKSALENSANTQLGTQKLNLIGKNNIPTLIIWGSKDRVIPVAYCNLFKEAISGSHAVVVSDAGHAPFAEKPAVVAELLRRFLA